MLRRGKLVRRFKLGTVLLAFVFTAICAIGFNGWADNGISGSLGEQLVREFWTAMKTQDVEALDDMLAPGFQSVHSDGARDRATQLDLISGLDLGEYTLTEFEVTRVGASVVVTYMVSVEETLAGVRTSSTPAPRLTIWVMTENGWQLAAHANLKAMDSGSS